MPGLMISPLPWDGEFPRDKLLPRSIYLLPGRNVIKPEQFGLRKSTFELVFEDVPAAKDTSTSTVLRWRSNKTTAVSGIPVIPELQLGSDMDVWICRSDTTHSLPLHHILFPVVAHHGFVLLIHCDPRGNSEYDVFVYHQY